MGFLDYLDRTSLEKDMPMTTENDSMGREREPHLASSRPRAGTSYVLCALQTLLVARLYEVPEHSTLHTMYDELAYGGLHTYGIVPWGSSTWPCLIQHCR